eukprot:TRINITY_DN1579_c0_g1_i1.p1 TRINITY_DN1579_c0_g1~~TRINITY_DN1579_c0_g1_i1.p1  ORF type:complete len:298 (-),score=129.26 TRINITY_DN1579_c0_g1_i1:398-1291(-)
MNKLVGFILGEKRERKKPGATPPRGEVAPPRFTPEEKEEIYATLRRAKDSRATVVLLNKMTEDEVLQQEFKDVKEVVEVVEADTDSTASVDEEEEGDQFGTMRFIPSSPRAERAASTDTADTADGEEDGEEGAMDFSTCRYIPEDEASGGEGGSCGSEGSGTFNFTPTRTTSKKGSGIKEDRRQGLKNRPGKKPKKASVRERKKKDKKQRKAVATIDGSPVGGEESPSFLSAYRAPEEWELNILALEKGEARAEMMDNGAFKRWNKKERPSMPSMLLKMDSTEPIQRDARAAENGDS